MRPPAAAAAARPPVLLPTLHVGSCLGPEESLCTSALPAPIGSAFPGHVRRVLLENLSLAVGSLRTAGRRLGMSNWLLLPIGWPLAIQKAKNPYVYGHLAGPKMHLTGLTKAACPGPPQSRVTDCPHLPWKNICHLRAFHWEKLESSVCQAPSLMDWMKSGRGESGRTQLPSESSSAYLVCSDGQGLKAFHVVPDAEAVPLS